MKHAGLFRGLYLGAMLAGMFFCVGCVGSLNPVLKDEQVTYDKDLLGEWIYNAKDAISHRTIAGKDDNLDAALDTNDGNIDATIVNRDGTSHATMDTTFASSYVTIREGQGNQYIISDVNGDEPEKWNRTGRLGKIDDQLIFEITIDPKGVVDPTVDTGIANIQSPTYSFGLLEKVSANQMKVRFLKPEWLKEYLMQHPDELVIQKKDKNDIQLLVTSGTDQWQAFVVKHLKDADAWSDPILFVHPGDPTTQPSNAATQPNAAELQPAGATTPPAK